MLRVYASLILVGWYSIFINVFLFGTRTDYMEAVGGIDTSLNVDLLSSF